ncbi:cation diffusion facilitator family transporter [Streptococcus danieliae]|uniref:Cation transporter n=1 Tax=Streptococcus danieliae TaxID=747656 RepID=A0A7Z0S491_9STRE|nr:cation diffusion facilitator family transporter [Streptococcus danieliae]MBF0699127.1 cation transporter [Streptococcus danieliae]NYS96303.1 cation transporter [Streptococcus danieliae]
MHQHSKTTFIAFILNLSFAILEAIFGVLFHSSAVLADAVHDFGDAMAIGLSAYLEKISTKQTDLRYTLGYQRFTILAALVTASILMTGSTFLIIENIPKIFNPPVVNHQGTFVLALLAIAINGFAAHLVHKGHSANQQILTLHFLEDILGWVAVLCVSILLQFTDWYFLDPLLSVAISLFILSQALPKFLKNLQIFLEKAPEDLNLESLREQIEKMDGVQQVSQFNAWTMDGQRHVAMLHLHIKAGSDERLLKDQVHHLLEAHKIVESAIELDYSSLEHQHHTKP